MGSEEDYEEALADVGRNAERIRGADASFVIHRSRPILLLLSCVVGSVRLALSVSNN